MSVRFPVPTSHQPSARWYREDRGCVPVIAVVEMVAATLACRDGKVRHVAGSLGAVIAPTPFSPHPDGTLVEVWVVPGARRTEVVGWHDGAVRVRVAAPPEGGRANRALLAVLRQTTEARRARLIRGATSRRKQVLLEGSTPAEVARLLGK